MSDSEPAEKRRKTDFEAREQVRLTSEFDHGGEEEWPNLEDLIPKFTKAVKSPFDFSGLPDLKTSKNSLDLQITSSKRTKTSTIKASKNSLDLQITSSKRTKTSTIKASKNRSSAKGKEVERSTPEDFCERNNLKVRNQKTVVVEKQNVPSGVRLARFLHFSRREPSVNASGDESLTDRGTFVSPSKPQIEFRRRLAEQTKGSVVRWEQPKSVWEAGFEDPDYACHSGETSVVTNHNQFDSEEENHTESGALFAKNKGSSKNIETSKKKRRKNLKEQWIEFKNEYPDLILLMEVGYKIQLFGKDAVLASKILSIGHLSIPGQEAAYFLKTNLGIYIERLVRAGLKVGLISQSETRSLKNGSRKNLFKRHLSRTYSLATWIESDLELPLDRREAQENDHSHQTWIMSLYESAQKKEESFRSSMVALCPQSGDIIWDYWKDDCSRSRLETLLHYFDPLEIVLPLRGISLRSEKLLNFIISSKANNSVKPRLESINQDFDIRSAYSFVTKFCKPLKRKKDTGELSLENPPSSADVTLEDELLQHIIELPDNVLISLADLIAHTSSYQLEFIFRQPGSFKPFSSVGQMLLDATTLRNLEIFQNSTDGSERGSLFWILDRTKTLMGKRLLKDWIGRPLTDPEKLRERADAIHEVTTSQSHIVILKAKRLLSSRLPDLEKALARIQYGKCTAKELIKFFDTMSRLAATFKLLKPNQRFFTSDLLNGSLTGFEELDDCVRKYCSELNFSSILKGNYCEMFLNTEEKYPHITEFSDCISCVEAELENHLQSCRTLLDNPKLNYITIGPEDYQIEVRYQHLSRVPDTWIKMGSTRAVQRFRTPEAQRLKEEREKYCDLLNHNIHECFLGFLLSMEEDYDVFRSAIKKLAVVDCIMSLAETGIHYNYCKPTIVDYPLFDVKKARHPIVEQLSLDPLTDNDVYLSQGGISTMILTGNNMGGKSVTSKMVACIILMAQIGCYVPAEKATIGIFESCFTRMGLTDDIQRGRSAFMVEMSETSNILKLVSPRSIVIFDELGYGTSTYDGLAIANAVLHHLITKVGCITIFITHYPQLHELSLKYPETTKSFHMKFYETVKLDGTPDITFLFKLVDGLATKSHGIHVARLAGLPDKVLKISYIKSKSLEAKVDSKIQSQRFVNLCFIIIIKFEHLIFFFHSYFLCTGRIYNEMKG
ncbi:muts domain V-domain-containing protein [Phakopsora pachyrhizi]|uniref:MutS protein homolog 3 n=1 Tax=Phakopsora pachyrhizi TaxID=170000 RepID=A0AAV0B119_PHAPC|nr:muts domain V-domain-containing protein [Phakopsora pachyrhizi]CAH7675923.1 muts domain V-domain-containing protein [Phakopsora pachyrhizi]